MRYFGSLTDQLQCTMAQAQAQEDGDPRLIFGKNDKMVGAFIAGFQGIVQPDTLKLEIVWLGRIYWGRV